ASAFLKELKRRKVLGAATLYAIVGFAVIEAADIIFPELSFPDSAFDILLWLVFLGFPATLVGAWLFDITSAGVKRTQPLPHGSADPTAGVAEAGAVAESPVAAYGPAPEKSIAVLRFMNMSEDSENEYFSDGVTEEITSMLANVPGLRVAARTSAFSFKGEDRDVTEIGQKLRVAALLEGSVRKSGQQVRIAAQLVNAADGFHIWSEVYDRELADIFVLQEEIARTIVEKLQVQFLGPVDTPHVARQTENLEAYNLCLKGRYFCNQRTVNGLRASIDYFQQAIALDDAYAQAYAGLADAYSLLGWYRHLSAEEVYPRIRWAAEKAIGEQCCVPEALTSRGYARFLYEWDFPGAEAEFRQAMNLDPGYPTVHHWYGEFLMAMGRLEEAREQVLQAHALDPLSLTINVGLGWSEYFLGRWEKAIEHYESVLLMKPDFVIVPWFLGPAYVQSGQYAKAVAFYEDWMERRGEHPGLVALLAQAHALAGHVDEAEDVYSGLQESDQSAPVFADYHALTLTALGRADEAFEYLEKALKERSWVLVFLKVDPAYEPLRSDPRFPSLLTRIGLPDGSEADVA
ncbi:MAG: tetratricopeptide repeat protein, partial [Nitrospiraceae bacterium]